MSTRIDERQTTTSQTMWRCMGDGELYVSPRCGMGAEHVEVNVETTVTVRVVAAGTAPLEPGGES